MNQTIVGTLRAASAIARASASDIASGFSHRTILPACAAAMATGACMWFGSEMSTASMSGRSIAARQSVEVSSQPQRSAIAASDAASRPQITCAPDAIREIEEVRGLAIGVRMGLAHEALPDEGDSEFGDH